MNSARIQTVFKTLGKLLNLDKNYGIPYASGIRAAVVALEDQNAVAANAGDPYSELQNVIVPALNSARSVVQGLDRLPTIAKAGVDAYLRVIGAAELGRPANTPPATVLDTLKTSMVAAADSVAPSGAFFNYFLTTYGVQLPQNGSPTLPDSLITTTIL